MTLALKKGARIFSGSEVEVMFPLDLKWMLLGILISQAFLYAARVPMHRALRDIGQSLSGGFRHAARWCRGTAAELSARSKEIVQEAAREQAEGKIEQEFRRLEGTFMKDLSAFPKLHRKLDDLVAKIETDYDECREAPPEAPGWAEAVSAMANVPQTGDPTVQKLMGEFHKSAVSSEKKALEEYRSATAKRHKILAAIRPDVKQIKGAMEEAAKTCSRALEATTRIDGFMDTYEKIRNDEDRTNRVNNWSAVNGFLISAIVMAVALGGAFINFQLIALPMSELVPAGGRLMGMSVPSIAALVIVLMEVAAGIFVMEMLGITSLFPQFAGIAAGKRRMILGGAVLGLLLLAGIESSLAILRDQIVAAESALKQSLAGDASAGAAAAAIGSNLPMIGQAVLGFILPWILALIAIPLEMLIRNATPVGLMSLSVVLAAAGFIVRWVATVLRSSMLALRSLYDVYIIVPLQLERLLRHKHMVPAVHHGPALDNPTSRKEGE